MIFGFFKKRDPERDVAEFVTQAKTQGGDNLYSVMAFGSFASGEFDKARSDMNLLVVLNDVSYKHLLPLSGLWKWWADRRYGMPLIIQKDELSSLTRAFPIEFLDMLDHHRVLYGPNPLDGLTVDRLYLTAECEHELHALQLKLRQIVALVGAKPKVLHVALARTQRSALSLFRAVVRRDDPTLKKISKHDALVRLAQQVGFDPVMLENDRASVEGTLSHTMDAIEKVLAYLGKK